jgi:hypothetical protein
MSFSRRLPMLRQAQHKWRYDAYNGLDISKPSPARQMALDADAHVYMRRLQMSIVKDVKRQTGKPECPITLQAAACFGKRVIESRGGRRRTR